MKFLSRQSQQIQLKKQMFKIRIETEKVHLCLQTDNLFNYSILLESYLVLETFTCLGSEKELYIIFKNNLYTQGKKNISLE